MDRKKKTIKGKKAEFSLQYFLISLLFVGLCSGVVFVTVNHMTTNSEVQDFDNAYLNNFQQDEFYSDLIQVQNESDEVSILDPLIPDILGTFIQKAVKPIKTAINSFRFMDMLIQNFFIGIGIDEAMSNLFNRFFYGVLIVVLVIGFLLIKMYMGKQDGGV